MLRIKRNEERMGHGNGTDFWRRRRRRRRMRDDMVRWRKEWKGRKKRREKCSSLLT